MSLPAIQWATVHRYFNRKKDAFEIYHQGGDVIILRKSDKKPVRIGHKFLGHTETLRPGHLKKIERTFGITREDILNN
ncbi:MAG: hypothetical protein WC374_01495 [Phycisphaerae bacterium]|jgi:hypothetical protein